ncbi:MAG TPA: glycosyltransferase family A protein [Allosphingosinicella sp.]
MSGAPAISVVMPVHNAGLYLGPAVRSILDQTLADFEFVILDDGSTDGSLERLRRWARSDGRIRLIENASRSGAAPSSNRVTRAASAALIARMDADDIAAPARLERQAAVLADHPDVVMVGALGDTIDDRGRRVRPPDYGRLVRRSAFAPFSHSTTMFRRDAFERAGGYREAAEKWEDVDLFLRMAAEGRILVLAEPLLHYRHTGRSTRSMDGEARLERSMALLYRAIGRYEQGESYDDLLERPPEAGRLDPRLFIECGSGSVWSGRRPGMLRRLLASDSLAFDSASLKTLVWAAWAEASPLSLRAALRGLLALRNARARRRLAGAPIVEWRPRG